MIQPQNIHSEELLKRAYAGRKPSFYAGLLAEIISLGKPGAILDVGAGLGLFVELARQWGIEVYGIEGSSYALESAGELFKGINMILHDIGERFPFEDGKFSNVVLNQVVEHIDKRRFQNVLRESYRVLRCDGRIFITSPSRRNIKEKIEPTHINLMLPSELRNALHDCGFQIVSQPNNGCWFVPYGGRFIGSLSNRLLRILPHDWLSATANAIARKPC